MIEVENLVKRYGNYVAVDHLSFSVEKRGIYGFLGPNGAGKSTTMNIMTGYIAASEGIVKINGHDMMKEPEEAKRNIGYLPEMPPLYQDMTVNEYLIFVEEIKKLPRKERLKQLEEVMDLTMISDQRNRLIKNLSKGYKQRVGLAQAILGYPDIIILDEPTVGLDPKQIIEIRELIKTLGEKHTIILSSHILSEVQAVCDEIMILSKGKLVASDTPEGLTHLISGSASLEITVLGSKEQMELLLQKMDQILSYHFESGTESNCIKVIIETDAAVDIRTALFYHLAEEKMPVMSMNRLDKSLEDVFLELTGADEETDKGGSEHDSNL